MAVNLASKFSAKVDEAFSREALLSQVTNRDYDWNGVNTVYVYNIPTVAMNDYTRSSSNRYGTPTELQNTTQTLTIRKDRSWTFTIDKLNKNQSQMVMDAGKAVARQVRLVVIPEVDAYTFRQMALNAGSKDATAATKNNAYSLLLSAQEKLGDANVPEEGRVALVSYAYANLLLQDPSFMRDCDTAQRMHVKGMLGEVDGCRIIRVPASRLPSVTASGTTTTASFILAHPMATVAPKALSEYRVHSDPPGISGWLCEGRVSYDAFVLANKAGAIHYQGPVLSA